jgi:hypothetical protein
MLLFGLALVAFGSGVTLMQTPSLEPLTRQQAQGRWDARPYRDYRLVVQIERLEVTCFQELNVRVGREVEVVRDTCQQSWLSRMTIARMFELSERLDLPPECFPSSSDCACQRVRVGQTEFNSELGYPVRLEWQRVLQPHWQHVDYWRTAIERRALPSCSSTVQPIRITLLHIAALN